MPVIRKRARHQAVDDDNVEDESPPPPRSQRPRSSSPSSAEDNEETDGATTSQQQMVKNLVRLALASEYSRVPLRRADISTKVLGAQSRDFRSVFDGAQLALRQTFGMELVELPQREKVTISQRRAAQKTQSTSTSAIAGNSGSKSWLLRSILPEKLRSPDIISPPKVPTMELESAYVGIYSFIVAVITLSGGTLSEAKLERCLKRANADQSTPLDRTDKVMARMIKEGYVVKTKENNGGEEMIEYIVGPRGKVEIGTAGTANLVRCVYGAEADDDLERRLERTLKLQAAAAAARQDADPDGAKDGVNGAGRSRRARRANGRPQGNGESEDDD